MKDVVAYVLSKNGEPLMPIYSYGRVRKFLKSGKAVVKSRVPCVIQLTYELPEVKLQEITLGVDPGRTNIGVCAITNSGDVLYSASITTRNSEIPILMSDRKAHRQASRNGERKKRQRKAVAKGTCFKEGVERQRILPQCEEPITVKYITNTEAKFCNRKRPEGWLTPTVNQLLQTHANVINLVKKILPITNIVLEINKFDFVKMENPNVRNWEYQKGKLWGYESVEAAVSERQGGRCVFCNNPIDHYHHIVPRHLGGSESVDNRAGVCEKHHFLVHTETKWEDKLKKKQAGLMKKYHALSIINQIMPRLIKTLAESEKNFFVTTGYDTKATREKFGLEKIHYIDAWCIAASILGCTHSPKFTPFNIGQFRRQDRALIHHQTERVYKLDGVVVAKNRNKRFEQKTDSLHEWTEAQIAFVGVEQTRKLLSKLEVVKSTRHYNNPNRLLPGTSFEFKGKRHVISGQLTGGMYFRAVGDEQKTNYPAKRCRVLTKNAGLVYI